MSEFNKFKSEQAVAGRLLAINKSETDHSSMITDYRNTSRVFMHFSVHDDMYKATYIKVTGETPTGQINHNIGNIINDTISVFPWGTDDDTPMMPGHYHFEFYELPKKSFLFQADFDMKFDTTGSLLCINSQEDDLKTNRTHYIDAEQVCIHYRVLTADPDFPLFVTGSTPSQVISQPITDFDHNGASCFTWREDTFLETGSYHFEFRNGEDQSVLFEASFEIEEKPVVSINYVLTNHSLNDLVRTYDTLTDVSQIYIHFMIHSTEETTDIRVHIDGPQGHSEEEFGIVHNDEECCFRYTGQNDSYLKEGIYTFRFISLITNEAIFEASCAVRIRSDISVDLLNMSCNEGRPMICDTLSNADAIYLQYRVVNKNRDNTHIRIETHFPKRENSAVVLQTANNHEVSTAVITNRGGLFLPGNYSITLTDNDTGREILRIPFSCSLIDMPDRSVLTAQTITTDTYTINAELDSYGSGYGKIRYANGMIYDGAIYHNKPEGRGELSSKSGEQYAGDFSNGKMSGNGTLRYTDGVVYTGGVLNGMKHGWGKEDYSESKLILALSCLKTIPHKPDLILSCEGYYWKNHMIQGKISYYDGSYYVGSLVNDQYDGYGKRVRNIKQKREDTIVTDTGIFKVGKLHGQAERIIQTGDHTEYFKGAFMDDDFNGRIQSSQLEQPSLFLKGYLIRETDRYSQTSDYRYNGLLHFINSYMELYNNQDEDGMRFQTYLINMILEAMHEGFKNETDCYLESYIAKERKRETADVFRQSCQRLSNLLDYNRCRTNCVEEIKSQYTGMALLACILVVTESIDSADLKIAAAKNEYLLKQLSEVMDAFITDGTLDDSFKPLLRDIQTHLAVPHYTEKDQMYYNSLADLDCFYFRNQIRVFAEKNPKILKQLIQYFALHCKRYEFYQNVLCSYRTESNLEMIQCVILPIIRNKDFLK